jgi:hypothetical protein
VAGNKLAIMAYDPGGTTGWCATSFDLGHLPLFQRHGLDALNHEIITMSCGELTGKENDQTVEAMELVNLGLERGQVDHIVFCYEDFILRRFRQDRDLLAPVRMIAKLELMNAIMWGFPEVKQQPSLAKSTVPDSRLKQYKLYQRGKPHANDAIRHNLTLIRRFAAKPRWLNELLGLAA